jgi:oxaloacetate decarboxylase beta subunit
MDQLRPVSARERIVFPVVCTIVASLLVPSAAALIGMLMLGNLFRESGVVDNLAETSGNAMMYITVIFIGVTVGATASAEAFLNTSTLGILALGLIAFAFSTFGGIVLGNIMCKFSGGKINPLIGSAGVSAVPMAARVSQKVGQEEDQFNFLLMHAMGPNVAGCIGTAVAAGVFLTIYR